MIWISNNIPTFIWGATTQSCPNFNSGLAKPALKLGHGWVITVLHEIDTNIFYPCQLRVVFPRTTADQTTRNLAYPQWNTTWWTWQCRDAVVSARSLDLTTPGWGTESSAFATAMLPLRWKTPGYVQLVSTVIYDTILFKRGNWKDRR